MSVFKAIIVAAGNSSRMKIKGSKIFESLLGIPVIKRTLLAFERSTHIDDAVIVCRDEDRREIKRLLIDIEINIQYVTGGRNRQESVLNGIKAVKEADYYVIHDGARPLIKPEMIDKFCVQAEIYGAVSAAVKAKDTYKLVDNKGFVVSTPDRDKLMAVQTPQIFRRDIYLTAADSLKPGKIFTDDCQIVENAGGQVKLVDGDYENIKITTPDDIALAESYLKGDQL